MTNKRKRQEIDQDRYMVTTIAGRADGQGTPPGEPELVVELKPKRSEKGRKGRQKPTGSLLAAEASSVHAPQRTPGDPEPGPTLRITHYNLAATNGSAEPSPATTVRLEVPETGWPVEVRFEVAVVPKTSILAVTRDAPESS